MQQFVRSLAAHDAGGSWSSHFRATFALGIPLIGSQLAQLAIHTTDVVIVGQLGAQALAAMVLAGQFFFTIFVFGSGFSIAVVPMVAQAYGRGDVVSVRRSIRMGMWVSILYTLLTAPLFYNAEAILLALGQKPEVAALAASYVQIIQLGLLPALLFAVLRALVSATGRAGIILYVTLVMLAILAFGTVLHQALAAAESLDATVANMRFAKPIDEALVLELARSHDAIVTVEEGCLPGGAGSAATTLAATSASFQPARRAPSGSTLRSWWPQYASRFWPLRL